MKRYSVPLIILIVFSLVFISVGCTKSFSDEEKTETVNAFLTEFFSFNKDNRYGVLTEDVPDKKELEEAVKKYMLPFKAFTSEQCYDTMRANRMPGKYDSIAFENSISVKPKDITVDLLRENVYSFEIIFDSEEANEAFSAPIKGEVSIITAENKALIDSIIINK